MNKAIYKFKASFSPFKQLQKNDIIREIILKDYVTFEGEDIYE